MTQFWLTIEIDSAHLRMHPDTLSDKLMDLLVDDPEIIDPSITCNFKTGQMIILVVIDAPDVESAKKKFRDCLNSYFIAIWKETTVK